MFHLTFFRLLSFFSLKRNVKSIHLQENSQKIKELNLTFIKERSIFLKEKLTKVAYFLRKKKNYIYF